MKLPLGAKRRANLRPSRSNYQVSYHRLKLTYGWAGDPDIGITYRTGSGLCLRVCSGAFVAAFIDRLSAKAKTTKGTHEGP